MLIRRTHKNTWVNIHVLPETVERLSRTCFRGTTKKLAGNFFRWDSAERFFASRYAMQEFLADVWETRILGTQTVEIEFPVLVGWSSTDGLHSVPSAALEEFYPNKRSIALRVRPEHKTIVAPKTNFVTITYKLQIKDDGLDIIVWTIYPGRDVGELKGNISQRENCVFFDWSHPGI